MKTFIIPLLLASTANCSLFSGFSLTGNQQPASAPTSQPQQPSQWSFGSSWNRNPNTSSSNQSNPAGFQGEVQPSAPSSGYGGMFNMFKPKEKDPMQLARENALVEENIFSRSIICSELKDKDSFIQAITTYTPNGVRRLLTCPNIEAVVATINPTDYAPNSEIFNKIKAAMFELLVFIKTGTSQIDRDRELVYCTEALNQNLQGLVSARCIANQSCTMSSILGMKDDALKLKNCERGYMKERVEALFDLVQRNRGLTTEGPAVSAFIIFDDIKKILGKGYYQIAQARSYIPMNKFSEGQIKAARNVIKAFVGDADYERIDRETDTAAASNGNMQMTNVPTQQ